MLQSVAMKVDAVLPIVWRISLSRPPAEVFALLDTDAGRERFWAERSRTLDERRFELTFGFGPVGVVEVLERRAPERLRILYFGADCDLRLEPDGEGTILTVVCDCRDPAEWADFHAGWVSWLLVLKGVAEYGVDLRDGRPGRGWNNRFVDQ